MITDADMRKINDERRRRGQTAISRAQAEQAASDAGHSGNGALEFLLGLSGVPWPSAMGMAGFILHEPSSPALASEAPTYSNDTSSSYSGGGGDFSGGGSDSSF